MIKKNLCTTLLVLIMMLVFVSTGVAAESYKDMFNELYQDVKDPANGYFSKEGIPYHSVETLIVEAPDYGHVSTSEAFSYYIWLEAMYGNLNEDYSGVKEAWQSMEEHAIPDDSEQPGFGSINNLSASYAPEGDTPEEYPVKFDHYNKGYDPLHEDLINAYGGEPMYLMHWLTDADNWYEYGEGTEPVFINTFQRGKQESTWETIPHPSIENFKYGGENGFLDLFGDDPNGYSKQWRYTNAPDAEARAIQAVYNAYQWAKEDGLEGQIADLVPKAAKMGDFLRSNMFDKYYKPLGAQDPNAPSSGYDSAHYLLSWYTSWGGDLNGEWAYKTGCSQSHFFYQNPMTAWILADESEFRNAMKSPNATRDWEKSLERQLEFYTWLQSSEGAIAGGATNSWNGRYEKYPAERSTFYDMAYVEHPVYEDPGSNKWFGTQVWGMQRVSELYWQTGNQMAKNLLDKWVGWVKTEITLNKDGTFLIPADIEWSGQPDTWTGSRSDNSDLHATVTKYGTDIGTAGSLANILIYYADATNDNESLEIAKGLLDRIWKQYRDDLGVSTVEKRADYSRFFEQEVYVPEGWTGKMGTGDVIEPGIKFIDIRSKYKEDPMYDVVKEAYDNGEAPELSYHRFWQQADYAVALGLMAELFPNETPGIGDGIKGDVNGDGNVNALDYVALRRVLLGRNSATNADVNRDGSINALDYVALKRILLG